MAMFHTMDEAEEAEKKRKTKMVFVVEYTGQDEGCTMDVMQTLANHGYTLLDARFEDPDGTTQSVMHLAELITPEAGKC